MMKFKYYSFALPVIILLVTVSCNKNASTEPEYDLSTKISVVLNEIPYRTEVFHRIPYTLKFWEYEKDNLTLQKIIMFDKSSGTEIFRIDKEDFPYVYRSPLPNSDLYTPDQISNYYMSIQIPIPLAENIPACITHKFVFYNKDGSEVIVEGAEFSPRKSESPVRISSPVKGNNWVFVSQSSMDYHFYVLFFKNGEIYRGERFAFDNLQLDDNWGNYFSGNPKDNNSYYNYGDTLYAVGDGAVISIKDGRPENNGDAQNIVLNSLDEYGGNYIIIQIGIGQYALYAHCQPYKFMVNVGDFVKEGDPIALLGNSGNSTAPHLHFQITESPELLFTKGLPFVLKKYYKAGDYEKGKVTPYLIENSMMEEMTVLNFDN